MTRLDVLKKQLATKAARVLTEAFRHGFHRGMVAGARAVRKDLKIIRKRKTGD